ncbi:MULTISPECIES: sensor histidine kinase [unclassified Modestobacter]
MPPPPSTRTRWGGGRSVLAALEQIGGGLGTALLAFCLLLWLLVVAALSLVGVGLFLVPAALRVVRRLADQERARLSRWGPDVLGPGPVPSSWRAAVADPAVHRDLAWVAVHGTLGLLFDLIGIALPIYAVRDLTYPLYWRALAPEEFGSPWWWPVSSWADAVAVSLLGLGFAALTVGATPGMARLQNRAGRRLLGPPPGTDLSLRVAELTTTRAAALDAHVAELRRIERSLHDGTQNRLVAVTVLLGAARRSLDRDPGGAEDLLERAQDAAEQALAELRSVARGILPPVLVDRGLAGALSGLAASSPVPCTVDVDVPGRCPASVEATAWFVVAEALTNVARHSGATAVRVTVRRIGDRLRLAVTDDGHGGAVEGGAAGGGSSGLAGVRRRVEAHDGVLTVDSPPGGPTTLEVELPCGS